nr:ribonuclease H-like domain-containing protein [Tanacetum cinerariifolium]
MVVAFEVKWCDGGGGLKLLGGISSNEVKKGCGSSGKLGRVEKARALGARGDTMTSWVEMVWIIVGGGIVSAKVRRRDECRGGLCSPRVTCCEEDGYLDHDVARREEKGSEDLDDILLYATGEYNEDEMDQTRKIKEFKRSVKENIQDAKTLKKGSPFRPDSETNEPPLRTYQLWKKTLYEETYKLDDMTELPKSRPKKTYEDDLESEIVMVKMLSCMSFVGCTNSYDEPIGNLDKMGDRVKNPSPQVLPSFEVYNPPVNYPQEVEETIGIPMEVEPLDKTKLKDLGLNTYNQDIPLSYREVSSFDELKPQPMPLADCPSLNISLEDKKGSEPPSNHIV